MKFLEFLGRFDQINALNLVNRRRPFFIFVQNHVFENIYILFYTAVLDFPKVDKQGLNSLNHQPFDLVSSLIDWLIALNYRKKLKLIFIPPRALF